MVEWLCSRRRMQQWSGPSNRRTDCGLSDDAECTRALWWLQAMIRLAHGMELMLEPECSSHGIACHENFEDDSTWHDPHDSPYLSIELAASLDPWCKDLKARPALSLCSVRSVRRGAWKMLQQAIQDEGDRPWLYSELTSWLFKCDVAQHSRCDCFAKQDLFSHTSIVYCTPF